MPSIGQAGVFTVTESLLPSEDDETETTGYQLAEFANLIWLCSLLLSIFCAVHALMLQRFAKPHTWVTSPLCCLLEQARMGASLARRIERADKTIRILHFMTIISLLVFFSGLIYFFLNVNSDSWFAWASLSLLVLHFF